MYRFSAQHLASIYTFLSRIGVPLAEEPLEDFTFLPGVTIRRGSLVVDRARLRQPGDVLVEAGRLALLPPELRHTWDATAGIEAPAEAPENAVILWCYAAAKAIGLPDQVVFDESSFRGDAAWLLAQYASGAYPGLEVLVAKGLCQNEQFPQVEYWTAQQ